LNFLSDVQLNDNICINEEFEGQVKIATMVKVVDSKCAFDETPVTDTNSSLSIHRLSSMDHLNQDCGKVEFTSGLIVNGTQTSRGQWPFLVALHHLENEIFFCGGSLISTRHVLTGE
jgi:hypothetical protein